MTITAEIFPCFYFELIYSTPVLELENILYTKISLDCITAMHLHNKFIVSFINRKVILFPLIATYSHVIVFDVYFLVV